MVLDPPIRNRTYRPMLRGSQDPESVGRDHASRKSLTPYPSSLTTFSGEPRNNPFSAYFLLSPIRGRPSFSIRDPKDKNMLGEQAIKQRWVSLPAHPSKRRGKKCYEVRKKTAQQPFATFSLQLCRTVLPAFPRSFQAHVQWPQRLNEWPPQRSWILFER